MSDLLKRFFLLLVVFHFIYPQALGIMGSSFILMSGVIGVGLYVYHKLPFKEIINLWLVYALLAFTILTSSFINNADDGWFWFIGYTRSQIAWFFSAYLIIFLLFKFHKNPTPFTVAGYIAGAIAFQCLLTVLIYVSEPIDDFLFSLTLPAEVTEWLKDEAEGQRLMGHGVGLFAAGFIAGYGLIFLMYQMVYKKNLTTKELFYLSGVYVFVFYIGIFSARTTIVGAGFSFILLALNYMRDYKRVKGPTKVFMLSSMFLLAFGYFICLMYFSDMADWAFELFDNFVATGDLSTRSSNGLEEMFYLPNDPHIMLFGSGTLTFFGSDVGYTRLSFFIGIPGMAMYFIYTMTIAKMSFTRDWATNVLLIVIVAYDLALNLKGLTDLNSILYLFFFFFLFYKYYKYRPMVYYQKVLAARQHKSEEQNKIITASK